MPSYLILQSRQSANVVLMAGFNALFDEARTIDHVVNPHPMLRMPPDIIHESFEARP